MLLRRVPAPKRPGRARLANADLAGSIAAATVTVRPPGEPSYGLSLHAYRQYQRRVYRALVVVYPDRLAIRPDPKGRRKGWPDVELPLPDVGEVAFDKAVLGSRAYLGLRDGNVLHFGVSGKANRLVAGLRAAGIPVRRA